MAYTISETTKPQFASSICYGLYQRLINFAMVGGEDTPEYADTIELLKNATKVESEEYNKLHIKIVSIWIELLENNPNKNDVEERCYIKLSEMLNKYTASSQKKPILTKKTSFLGKIRIRTLKAVKDELGDIEDRMNYQDSDIEQMNTWLRIITINTLKENSYTASIALDNGFNIDDMINAIDEDTEEEKASIPQSEILAILKSEILTLAALEIKKEAYYIVISEYQIARIRILMEYLTKNGLRTLRNIIEEKRFASKKDITNIIKRLLKLREEEL